MRQQEISTDIVPEDEDRLLALIEVFDKERINVIVYGDREEEEDEAPLGYTVRVIVKRKAIHG